MSQRSMRRPLSVSRTVGVCTATLMLFPSTLQTQVRTGQLRGTVLDPAGSGLADARVSVVGTDFSVVTSSEGTYRFTAVPAGTYSLRAEFPAYQPVEMHAVRILPGQTLTADFRLAPTAPPPIEGADTCPDPMVPRANVLAKAMPSPLPERVLGVPRTETFWGDVARSHSDATLGPGARSLVTWVGVYGHGESAVEVGAHRLGCANAARVELRRLAAQLDAASVSYGLHASFDVKGVEVHALSGERRRTYVFAREAEVWWVTALGERAAATLAGLLHVQVDVIPDPTASLPGDRPER